MNQADASFKSHISEQSFIDLCTWLSDDKAYSKAQLERLKSENHYLTLIELANSYWLIGHLAKQLQKRNIWVDLPIQLQDYLTKFEALYLQRSQAIQQEVISVSSLLSKVTSKLVLLKGGASLFNGVADPISTRYMADIDILVPANKLASCLDTLKTKGYILDTNDASINTDDFHHAPPAIRKDGPCYIELHRRPLVNSLKHLLSAKEAISTAVNLQLSTDLQVQQMHPTQQIIHTIAHSELQDLGHAEAHMDLRQLLNFYLIAKTFAGEICWLTVEQRYAETKQTAVLQAVCYQAYRLFGLPIAISEFEQNTSHLQYQRCIQNFIQIKSDHSIFSSLAAILQGYSKTTIVNLYGETGYFPVTRGRLRHLKRHLLMLLKGQSIN